MKRPLIIGMGNPLRQDDAIGLRASRLLQQSRDNLAADVAECFQLTPELATPVSAASEVIFLDAAVDDTPGQVRCRTVVAQEPGAWSHHLSPGQLIGWTRAVYGEAPPAHLVTGGALYVDLGEGLTPAAEDAAVQIASLTAALISAGR